MVERRLTVVLGDFLISLVGFLLAGRIRFGSSFQQIWELELALPRITIFAPALGGLVVAVAWSVGLYRRDTYWSVTSEIADLIKAYLASLAVVMSLLFFFRLEDVSRLMLAAYVIIVFAGSVAFRLALRQVRSRATGGSVRVLLAGTDKAGQLLSRFEAHPHLGVGVVGYVGHTQPEVDHLPRLGDLEDLPQVLSGQVVDEVVICLPVEEWRYLDAISELCQEQGKAVRVPVSLVQRTLHDSSLDEIDGIPLLTVGNMTDRLSQRLAKRVIDIVVSSILIVLLSPILLGVALAMWMAQGRPVLFVQERGGRAGRTFRAYKLRTMEPDAHAQRSDLDHLNERVGPVFKIRDDPRITPIGRWLRKSSIDELPQLLNVLKGEMSLVGPRPQPIEEIEAYDFWHRRRLSMKPGITGLWQVKARNDPNFDQWMALDLEYIDSWSLWQDPKILAQTPIAVFRNPGI